MHSKKSTLFLKSALSVNNCLMEISDAINWIENRNKQVKTEIEQISFEELENWTFSKNNFSIEHKSGKFFQIKGINVSTNYGNIQSWDQPIIDQPEIGYLGFITKEFNGILHFLVQGKIEPGNTNYVQLSPTLQATKSNYTRAHKGKSPAYLDYFLDVLPENILLDQLQSEQGARFLRKRNRNIIIKINEDINVLEDFIWLSLGQIKELMKIDNIVNMDTRTVISGITYFDNLNIFPLEKNDTFESLVLQSYFENKKFTNSFDSLLSFITRLKTKYFIKLESKPLDKLVNWNIKKSSVSHRHNKYFNVIAVKVKISNREVQSWTQPMIQPAQEGLCAFIAKKIDGILHFIVQAKLECGNFDTIELAPTVQCLTGNYRNSDPGQLPFLKYVLNVKKSQIWLDALQSEEGGRFYKEQNRNLIIFADDELDFNLPENYIWMTLNQIQTFIKFNNYINIQARSLISALRFIS